MKKDIVKKAVSIFTSIFLCFSVVFSITTQAFSAEVNVISSEWLAAIRYALFGRRNLFADSFQKDL